MPHSHYCLPVKIGKATAGVLILYLEAGHRYDPLEERYLKSICAILARIIEYKQLQKNLFHLQKMEVMGRFASGIVHDFNNVLFAADSYLKSALSRARKGDPIYEDLTEMDKSLGMGRQIVKQILSFAGKSEKTKKEDLVVGEFLVSIGSMMERIAGPEMKVRLPAAESPCRIKGDGKKLSRAFFNFVSNSRDAGAKEIKISVELLRNRFCDVSTKNCDWVKLVFEDDGEGMIEETKSKIFEPFFTTKKEGKGIGLGMAMVYEIIKEHGGTASVESEKGKGTKFSVFLPAS